MHPLIMYLVIAGIVGHLIAAAGLIQLIGDLWTTSTARENARLKKRVRELEEQQ